MGRAIENERNNRNGGVAIDVEFEGTLEFSYDKKTFFTLHNNGSQHDRFGMRFIKRKGSIKLHGVEETKIKSAKVYFYEF